MLKYAVPHIIKTNITSFDIPKINKFDLIEHFLSRIFKGRRYQWVTFGVIHCFTFLSLKDDVGFAFEFHICVGVCFSFLFWRCSQRCVNVWFFPFCVLLRCNGYTEYAVILFVQLTLINCHFPCRHACVHWSCVHVPYVCNSRLCLCMHDHSCSTHFCSRTCVYLMWM